MKIPGAPGISVVVCGGKFRLYYCGIFWRRGCEMNIREMGKEGCRIDQTSSTNRFPGKSIWPEGAPYALCLTHDVDRISKHPYHYFISARKGGINGILRQIATLGELARGRSSYWNFDRILEWEEQLGVRSTFLFLSRDNCSFGLTKPWGSYTIRHPRLKETIREMIKGGWEVGLHGSESSSDDPDRLSDEKKLLEDITGKKVTSIRQHNLRLIPGITWRIQAEAGFEVDSTGGYAERYHEGYPQGGSRKILPFSPEGLDILVLPMTLIDTLGYQDAVVRGNIKHLLKSISMASGLIVMNWHQETFNRLEHPARVDFYLEVIREARSSGAWIATMGEIGEYWKKKMS